jgi:hypothetical protein
MHGHAGAPDLNLGQPYIGVLLAGTKGRTPDLRSDDEGGSFAAGRARKSLSLPGRFRNTTMEKPAVTDTLQDLSRLYGLDLPAAVSAMQGPLEAAAVSGMDAWPCRGP